MDLKELDYIVTVANEGSISRAAEKLFMAQLKSGSPPI